MRYFSVLAALFALGCSGLPNYAAPQGGMVDAASVDMSDVISYRALSREDFKGSEPPPEFAAHRDKLGAATCVNILSSPDTSIWIQEVPSSSGESSFEGSIKHVGFYARMNRKCSWWNQEFRAAAASYVLEHEQIHFALHELEARKLNASTVELKKRVRVKASSAEAAQELVSEEIKGALLETLEASIERNRDFDEDTSLGYKPERQKKWLATVKAELAATAR